MVLLDAIFDAITENGIMNHPTKGMFLTRRINRRVPPDYPAIRRNLPRGTVRGVRSASKKCQDQLIKEVLTLIKDNPTLSSTDLAKKLAYLNPDKYETVEKARSTIRSYRGTIGKLNRAEMTTLPLPRVIVPKSDATSPALFEIPYSDFPVIIGADAHIPYHDEAALQIFIDRAATAKTIILLGDWMDMYSISSFVIDPTAKTLPQEIEIMRDFLASLRSGLPEKADRLQAG